MGKAKRQFSVDMEVERIAEVDEVSSELVPPASRNSTLNYLVGLGLEEHRRRRDDAARAMAVLQMAREEVPA